MTSVEKGHVLIFISKMIAEVFLIYKAMENINIVIGMERNVKNIL